MNAFFPVLIFGHLIGDYLLQNKWMAMGKSGNTLKCLVHCAIYTASVVFTTWDSVHGFLWTAIIFASHFPIDRWSLADKWLGLINGRSLQDFLVNGKKNIPFKAYDREHDNYHVMRGSFTTLVYAVTDNTMHLAIMYYGVQFLR